MRIGIVTFWKNNYGSALQAYATKKYLSDLGFEVDILNERYVGVKRYTHFIAKKVSLVNNAIKHSGFIKYYMKHCQANKGGTSYLTSQSSKEIDEFIYQFLSPYECSYNSLRKYANDEATVAILAGSDQIWNCSNGNVNPYYFLDFVPANKRIGFAASFGISELPAFLKAEVTEKLKNYRKISVREDSGKSIIKELLGIEVERLADPTVLLTCDEWREFCKGCKQYPKPYILVHFIDEPNDLAVESIKKLTISNTYDVICFGYHHDALKDIPNIVYMDGGPEDYVFYIDNAIMVLTDSFHSSLFSINMGTNFCVFDRQYKQFLKQGSRITTLLQMFQLDNHHIVDQQQAQQIGIIAMPERSKISSVLTAERQKLVVYLNESLPYVRNEKELKKSYDCTGCGACIVACNHNAIVMENNSEGFSYPKIIESKCIKCGNCSVVCNREFSNSPKVSDSTKAYVLINKDTNLRNKSASGGAFSSLATMVLKKGGVVCGAAMNFEKGNVTVEHIIVDNYDELYKILGSKYVQSNCYGIFNEIRRLLKDKIFVLFSGTSCQVNALYRYLGNQDIDNLLTVDLICHGVPSQAFFQAYIQYLESKYKMPVTSFSFREKTTEKIEYTETITLGEGPEKKIVKIPASKSSYYRLFLLGETYRSACYSCKYASMNKPADITVGDYFEIEQDYPELVAEIKTYEGCGVSCLITHNRKGEEWIEAIENLAYIFSVNPFVIQKSHAQLRNPMKHSDLRDYIFNLYSHKGYSGVASYYKKQDAIKAIPRFIKHKLLRR